MWVSPTVPVFIALLLAGCGNKGDLYLPGEITDAIEQTERENLRDESEGEEKGE